MTKKKLKILFVSPVPTVSRTLGATKAILDAANSIQAAGAECDIFPQEDQSIRPEDYIDTLKHHITSHSQNYDVIEIPDTIPVDLKPFSKGKLYVVRSALLELHLKYIHFPEQPSTLKSRINHWVREKQIQRRKSEAQALKLQNLMSRLMEADLINVQNTEDQRVLEIEGIPPKKILLQPCGVDHHRLQSLHQTVHAENANPQLVFIGTFDFRKGCLDLIQIFQAVLNKKPGTTLKILGAKGLMTSSRQILSYFPKSIRNKIELHLRFEEQNLPALLQNCDVGIFPSYWEGFGIGVVEMLAAGIPVVAYDAPGPCDILPKNRLVPPGDHAEFASKVIDLIDHKDPKEADRCKSISDRYEWANIGRQTLDAYEQAIQHQLS